MTLGNNFTNGTKHLYTRLPGTCTCSHLAGGGWSRRETSSFPFPWRHTDRFSRPGEHPQLLTKKSVRVCQLQTVPRSDAVYLVYTVLSVCELVATIIIISWLVPVPSHDINTEDTLDPFYLHPIPSVWWCFLWTEHRLNTFAPFFCPPPNHKCKAIIPAMENRTKNIHNSHHLQFPQDHMYIYIYIYLLSLCRIKGWRMPSQLFVSTVQGKGNRNMSDADIYIYIW